MDYITACKKETIENHNGCYWSLKENAFFIAVRQTGFLKKKWMHCTLKYSC